MDYMKFYGMEAEPFRNDPDRRFYFEGNAPAQARIRLLRGLWQCKGLCVLIGGPGAGKTTLARHLLDSLNGKNRTVRLLAIPHSDCDAGWVLPRIAAAFGVARPATRAMGLLGQILEQFARIRAAGSHPVLFIDEAQMLRNREVMEEFRRLLNLEHKGAKLLSLVLLGLPELSDVLHLDEPLAQRVDIRIQLGLLDGSDTAEYIKHRLSCVGGGPGLFSEDAIKAIHRYSRGVPRTINTLCDNALFEAYLARQKSVDGSLVNQVARDLDLAPEEKAHPSAARQAEPEAPERDLVHEVVSQGLAIHDAWVDHEVEHDVLMEELPSHPRRAVPQPAVPQPSPSVTQRPEQSATEAAPRPQVAPPASGKLEVQPAMGSDTWAPPRKPSTPLTPAEAEFASAPVTQVWDSPILEEPEHELSFSDDRNELSLEAAEQIAESTPAPAPEHKEPPTLSRLSDGPDPDGETRDTLAGLVMEMDEDWRSQPPQREPQPQATPQPQVIQRAAVDPPGRPQASDLVDALFDEIQLD